MNTDIKVSIIVPVYNCERYLERCIESLVGQTLDGIEIILIDDGSSDRSSDICKLYEGKYNNCRYIYQENGGVSKARNRGINEAKGNYIMFSDADDYYEINAAELLYNKMVTTQADIVCGGIIKYFTNHKEIQECQDYCAKGEEFNSIIVQMTKNYAINQVWGKMFRSRCIRDNSIYFDESMKCGEDLEWLCRVLEWCEIIAGVSQNIYSYQIYDAITLSKKFDFTYFDRIYKSYQSMINLYKTKKMYEKYGELLHKRQDRGVWDGFQKINDKSYQLKFTEKVNYIRSGKKSMAYREYKKRDKKYLSKGKIILLNIRNSYILVIVFTMLSYLR